AASFFAERIKVNTVRRETRDGKIFWIKRRRGSAALTLALANRFFRVAGNPVRALAEAGEGQRWGVEWFQPVHGDRYVGVASEENGVALEEMPGVSLASFLDHGRLTPAMAAAAGRELRRCHAMESPGFGGPWSHGDPHAGNFLYSAEEDRARLIDFELVHHR